jgi:hypothetical protein
VARTRRPVPVPPGPGPEPARRFTLGDIALKTAVPPRLLQFWTDSRLILPEGADEHPGIGNHGIFRGEHPGRGIAREFSDVEVQIASLLGPLAMGGLPIGRLKSFAYIFRNALTGDAPPQQRMVGGAILDYAELRRALDRAAQGIGANFFIYSTFPAGLTLVATLTDEKGPPKLDLAEFFQQPVDDPSEFPRGDAMTVMISLTERLAPLFR